MSANGQDLPFLSFHKSVGDPLRAVSSLKNRSHRCQTLPCPATRVRIGYCTRWVLVRRGPHVRKRPRSLQTPRIGGRPIKRRLLLSHLDLLSWFGAAPRKRLASTTIAGEATRTTVRATPLRLKRVVLFCGERTSAPKFARRIKCRALWKTTANSAWDLLLAFFRHATRFCLSPIKEKRGSPAQGR